MNSTLTSRRFRFDIFFFTPATNLRKRTHVYDKQTNKQLLADIPERGGRRCTKGRDEAGARLISWLVDGDSGGNRMMIMLLLWSLLFF